MLGKCRVSAGARGYCKNTNVTFLLKTSGERRTTSLGQPTKLTTEKVPKRIEAVVNATSADKVPRSDQH